MKYEYSDLANNFPMVECKDLRRYLVVWGSSTQEMVD